MCSFNKVNLSAILLVHKRIINNLFTISSYMLKLRSALHLQRKRRLSSRVQSGYAQHDKHRTIWLPADLQNCNTAYCVVFLGPGDSSGDWLASSMTERSGSDRRERRSFIFFQKVQTDSRAHRNPYLTGVGGSFLETWSWTLTHIECWG